MIIYCAIFFNYLFNIYIKNIKNFKNLQLTASLIIIIKIILINK